MGLGEAIAQVAPLYNLGLVIIAIVLFIVLFRYESSRFAYRKPWVLLFIAIIIFVVETAMTILRGAGLLAFHPAIFGAFEFVIISLFIYTLLLQKQFIKTGKKD